MQKPLNGKVALVTGASRGVGKGVALQLAEAGALVYITARTMEPTEGVVGSLQQTSDEILRRHGKSVPVKVDHADDGQVASLFERISKEQGGQLDILVNCAFGAAKHLMEEKAKPFWEMKPERYDDYMNVGLRSHYICTVHAARLMVPHRRGLIVFISSMAGSRYSFNALYGIGKAATDRMAIDCGIELRDHNVAVLSVQFSGIRTEFITKRIIENASDDEYFYTDPVGLRVDGELLKTLFKTASSQEFPGKVVVGLATNPRIIKYTAQVILAADYAREHNIRDIDNRYVPSVRQANYGLLLVLPKQFRFIRDAVPDFIKAPQILYDFANLKF